MTLEQYMRELWLMDKQYGQEEELYPLINMLLRDGVNTENLSIRDVHKSERIKADNNKNVKSRKYIDGFGSFPDLAIFDESFPDFSGENLQEENIVSNLQKIYGCVEAKCNKKNPEQIEVKIVAENKSEQPKQKNYFIERNNTKTYLHYADTGKATDEGQFLGELLWYGKVLYTNGVIWKYYKLCNGVQREHNKKLNNGLPILHKVPPKRDYGRYFCIMAEKGGTSHGGLTEKLSLFFHAKKQEVNAYGR